MCQAVCLGVVLILLQFGSLVTRESVLELLRVPSVKCANSKDVKFSSD